jgi:class 3 adenylate cyclase
MRSTKQLTVLFADVVHSMDIAATVGAERLREIVAELANRCAAVVQRYGATVAQFTGNDVMAVFGARPARVGCGHRSSAQHG